MEQLGPFHLFFTLSCAEMRWPSVLADVFKTIGNGRIKIHYPKDDWDGTAEEISVSHLNEHGEPQMINGKLDPNLSEYQKWYFEQKKISMTDFLKDHFILITRIFDKRVKDFITEVMKKKGIVNYAYRVEFQMRGLPHIHLLVIIHPDDKPRSADDVDKVVCAEIPDPETNPLLHKLVKEKMIHGPCYGFNHLSPCMLNSSKKCEKNFPKLYSRG